MSIKKRIIEEVEVKCPNCNNDIGLSIDFIDNGESMLVTYLCPKCNEKYDVEYIDILIAETIWYKDEEVESIYWEEENKNAKS